MVGVVRIGNPNLPEQSAKSVYPLAIANYLVIIFDLTFYETIYLL